MQKFETETKILEVDWNTMLQKFKEVGATPVSDREFAVDWYRPIGEQLGEENWYLRIRRWTDGDAEVTWKGKREVFANSRRHQEIEFSLSAPDKLAEIFTMIGLEHYAHQEKKRSSWVLDEWKFDLDRYPHMPPYLEIEGKDDEHIQKAIGLLGVQEHLRCFDGERVLIMEKYGLDWLDMRF